MYCPWKTKEPEVARALSELHAHHPETAEQIHRRLKLRYPCRSQAWPTPRHDPRVRHGSNVDRQWRHVLFTPALCLQSKRQGSVSYPSDENLRLLAEVQFLK